MAFTQQQIDELEAAIAQGALTVRYSTPGGDRQVTYRSLSEMMSILVLMKQSVSGASAQDKSGIVYGSFSKGLCRS